MKVMFPLNRQKKKRKKKNPTKTFFIDMQGFYIKGQAL